MHSFDLTSNVICSGYSAEKDSDRICYAEDFLSFKIDGSFSRVPTDAAIDIDNDILDMLEPFDYSRIEKFHPGYLAGYFSYAFDQTNKQTFSHVKGRVESAIIDYLVMSHPEYCGLMKKNITHKVCL